MMRLHTGRFWAPHRAILYPLVPQATMGKPARDVLSCHSSICATPLKPDMVIAGVLACTCAECGERQFALRFGVR